MDPYLTLLILDVVLLCRIVWFCWVLWVIPKIWRGGLGGDGVLINRIWLMHGSSMHKPPRQPNTNLRE